MVSTGFESDITEAVAVATGFETDATEAAVAAAAGFKGRYGLRGRSRGCSGELAVFFSRGVGAFFSRGAGFLSCGAGTTYGLLPTGSRCGDEGLGDEDALADVAAAAAVGAEALRARRALLVALRAGKRRVWSAGRTGETGSRERETGARLTLFLRSMHVRQALDRPGTPTMVAGLARLAGRPAG